MRIFFDTEFLEDGATIEPISVGLVREDGKHLYLENSEFDWNRPKVHQWLHENVRPYLCGPRVTRREIAESIVLFVGDSPEFWAYYADYDWVLLCQLYGTMMDLPQTWPMFCMDLRQLMQERSFTRNDLPVQIGTCHHALADAEWVRRAHDYIVARDRG